jgi:hypothetical protein
VHLRRHVERSSANFIRHALWSVASFEEASGIAVTVDIKTDIVNVSLKSCWSEFVHFVEDFGHAKVSQDSVAISTEKDVSRLDIPMDDVLLVEIFERNDLNSHEYNGSSDHKNSTYYFRCVEFGTRSFKLLASHEFEGQIASGIICLCESVIKRLRNERG